MSKHAPLDLAAVTEQARRLFDAAQKLNQASDALRAPITAIEESLNSLHLGIMCWQVIPTITHTQVEIGYTRVDGKVWGLALRDGATEWAFNAAPRHYRIAAIDQLEALLIGMTAATVMLTEQTKQAASHAAEMMRAVKS